jgi:hypothetical protein
MTGEDRLFRRRVIALLAALALGVAGVEVKTGVAAPAANPSTSAISCEWCQPGR